MSQTTKALPIEGSSGSCSNPNFPETGLYDKVMYGGIGYGKFCVPKELPSYIMLIVFPPLYVTMNEINTGFKRFDRIIICFILTSFFYFPGLLYGLSILRCGSIRSQDGELAKCT